MEIIIIAAVAKNGIIGSNGKIPWHSKEDFIQFKKVTTGYPVVMGRKTFESLGKPLKERLNIIITRNADYKCGCQGVAMFHDVKSAIEYCRNEIRAEKIFIIGGGEIYRDSISLADTLRISRMDLEPDGDVAFPEIDAESWMLESQEEFPGFQLAVYKRK
jgi:dihydrofolate reductase